MAEESWPLGEKNEATFDSCDELLTRLMNRGSPNLLYRGQAQADWPLTCSLSRCLRDEAKHGDPNLLELMDSMVQDQRVNRHIEATETRLLRSFMDEAQALGVADLPDDDDRLGWWELMQHHSAPTRLLDWTRSPFIGLWFAFWHHDEADGDAALWIFDARNSWINHLKTMATIETSDWQSFQSGRTWQNRLAQTAIANDEPVPLIINPRVVVPRVAAQQSVMTLIPNIDAPTSFGHHVFQSVATKVRLKATWKAEVLRVCDGLGLNKQSLFRDLDSVGEALQELTTGRAGRTGDASH
jgi:hypothetical protein